MKARDFDIGDLLQLLRVNKADKKVRKEFHRWVHEVEDLELSAGRDSWDHLNSNKVSKVEKIVLLAALLYVISPIDLVSDAIPVLGWLDDIGVAGLALNYVMRRTDAAEGGKSKKVKKRSKKKRGKRDGMRLLTGVAG